MPNDCLVTPEFAQRVGAISTDIRQPVCVYVNRRGQVMRVGVGSPSQTRIPPMELPRYGAERLSGIRCIATQLKAHAPNEAALTALALQRLDALAVLTLTGEGFQRRSGVGTGYVGETFLAHLMPEGSDNPWTVSEPLPLADLTQQDFLDLVDGLEAEFSRDFTARQVGSSQDRVLMVGVMTADQSQAHFDLRQRELRRLVESAGGDVLDSLTQKRGRPHPQTVLGAGKLQDMALAVQTTGANLVVFDRDLSPAQVRNLENEVGVRVVDRTELILDIFAQRARSGAGKLQVELAQLEYQLPRLTGRGQAMSRLGGGIGTRGPGETKLETERRSIQRRISKLQQDVNQLQAHRARLRQRRQHDNVPSVAVVGYTNAGKSTLLNTLTNAQVYAADQLFATLDPSARRLTILDEYSQQPHQLVLTDTVGFIEDLPPALMDAFRATLEEVTEADALLHVVDLSHRAWRQHIQWVNEIVGHMPLAPGPSLLVFNKLDQADSAALEAAKQDFPQAAYVSATDRLGLHTLRQQIVQLIGLACVPTPTATALPGDWELEEPVEY